METLGEYQIVFRRNKFTTDQVFILKQIIANSYEHNLDMNVILTDFSPAFDTNDRMKMIEILKKLGVAVFDYSQFLLKLIKITLGDSRCRVLIYWEITEFFKIRRGLRQGDSVSPIVFNLVLERIIKRSGLRGIGMMYRQERQILAYVDNIVIAVRTKKSKN